MSMCASDQIVVINTSACPSLIKLIVITCTIIRFNSYYLPPLSYWTLLENHEDLMLLYHCASVFSKTRIKSTWDILFDSHLPIPFNTRRPSYRIPSMHTLNTKQSFRNAMSVGQQTSESNCSLYRNACPRSPKTEKYQPLLLYSRELR